MKKILLLILSVFLFNNTFSQLVGTNCFLQGTYAEVGICNKGVYGAGVAPAGYHPNVGTNLGFVADAGKNGWTVPGTTPVNLPNYCGDYFVPGSPEEGWCIELGGPAGINYGFFQVNCTGPIGWTSATVPTTFSSYTATATERKVFLTLQATAGPMAALRIEKEITLPMNDLYFTTKVKITNISAATVNNVFYMRNVDPDNDQPWFPCRPGSSVSGSFTTTNVVHSQPSATSCDAHVSATGPCGCYLGYAARDPRARVSKGNFSSRDASNVWFGTGGHITTIGSTSVADEAISLSFNLGNILPGETKTFAYAYILSASDIAKAFAAIDDVVSFADGSSITSTGTTKRCAGAPVALSVSSTAGTTYSWTWSPGSTLSTTSGPATTASPLVTTTYTARGITSCDTVYKYITVVVNDPTSFTHTTTNSTCGASTGSITVTGITGGVGPYRYQFCSTCPIVTSSTMTGLAAGSYTVTVRDTGNCAYSKIVTVGSTGSVTSLTINSTNTTCGYSNGTVNLMSPTGGSPPYSYSFNGGTFGTTTSFTGLASGTYSVVVQDGAGCLNNYTATVGASPGISSFTATTTPSTCGMANGIINITSVTGGLTPYSYSFSLLPFTTSSSFTASSAGTHTVVIQDANTCTYSNVVSVTNIPGPSAQAYTVVPSTCGLNNGSVTMGVTTGGTGPYMWSFNGGAFSTNITYSGLAGGTYTLSVRDNNSCIKDTSVIIPSFPGPSTYTYTKVNTTCGASTGIVTVTSVTGGTPVYEYSFNGAPYTTNNSFSSLAPNPAYTLVVKDVNGCTYTQTIGISTTGSLSSATISKNHTSCGLVNGSINIGAIVGGSAPFEYNFNSTGFGSTNTFTGLSAGTYSIVIRDVFGCLLNINEVINPSTKPSSVSFTVTNATCGLNNGGLSIGTVTGGTPPYNYSFNLTAFTTNNNFTGLSSGTSIPLSIVDASGCRLDTTVTITNTPPISGFNITVVPSTCGLSNAVVTVDPTSVIGGSTPYQYSFNGSAFTTNSNAVGVTANVAYSVTVTDMYGCSFTKVVPVNNIGGPVALNLSSTPASCGNNNGTVTVTGVVGGTLPYEFEYNLSGVLTTSTSITGLAPNPTYLVRVEDANGCTLVNNVNVGNILNPTSNSGITSEVCAGSVIKLTGSVGGSATGGTWSSLGDGTFTNPTSLITTYTPGPVDISTNKVTLVLTSVTPPSVPCPPAVSSLTVTINPNPNPLFLSNNNSGCIPLCVDFIDSSNVKIGSVVKWKWNFGTGTDSSVAKTPNFCYTTDGNYNVKLEVTTDKGCSNSVTVNNFVKAYPVPYAEFTYDPKETTTSKPEIMFTDLTSSSIKWVWDFGDKDSSNIKNPTHTYKDTGTYNVTLITMNQHNCSDTVWYKVIIKPDYMFYIPTAFSPNVDGKNENFSGKGFGIQEYKMEIFNRWGEVIYETNDIEKGWDGKYKNNEVQQDTYVYKITIKDLNNKFHPYTGTITLVR